MYTSAYKSETGVYTFSGKDYGHGFGMSQIGAKNRAASGQTYEQILKFYFDGTYTENLTPKASIDSFAVSSREDDTKLAALAVYDAPVINSFIASNAESLLGQQCNSVCIHR